jgi:2-dehydropantoate 2-reductase
MADRPSTQVVVVGAGGIGCAVGYALRKSGVDVTFVDADEQKIRWGRSHGVGLDRRALLTAHFEHFEEWQPPAEGTVILCTKCYDNEAVLSRLPSSLRVFPIQNGFDPNLIEYSDFEGIASFISECTPGRTHTRITRAGALDIGGRGGSEGDSLPADLEQLARRLERYGRFRVKRVPDVLPLKYAKLMYNAAISPLAAVSGLDNGQLLTDRKARKLFFALLRENYDILMGAGVTLGKVGPFRSEVVSRILSSPIVSNGLAWPFSLTLRRTYCSMSGDLPKGRTEIDYYNGHLIELAGDRDFPLNLDAYALVKRMERERLAPALPWLYELLPSMR